MRSRPLPDALLAVVGLLVAGFVLEKLIRAMGQAMDSASRSAAEAVASAIPTAQTPPDVPAPPANPDIFGDPNPWRGVDPTDFLLPDSQLNGRPTVALVEPGEPLHP